MRTSERQGLPEELLRARNRFEAWRSLRQGRGRIPQALWVLAADLARAYGVSRTAVVLGLDYYSLKKRAQLVAQSPSASGPAFVELPGLVGKQCLFELQHGTGACRRVQLVGYDVSEVATLARCFWKAD